MKLTKQALHNWAGSVDFEYSVKNQWLVKNLYQLMQDSHTALCSQSTSICHAC